MDFDLDCLRERLQAMNDRAVRSPTGGLLAPTCLEYAVEVLSYRREDLLTLPRECTQRFAGVGNPHRIADIVAGATVLDHACGAGMDLLLAARRVGPAGRAIGVDMTPAMRDCAARAAAVAGLGGVVEILEGTFEDLPVADCSVDYVISNGVLCLAPNGQRVLEEAHRVMRPGGRLLLADLVLSAEPMPRAHRHAGAAAAATRWMVDASELVAQIGAAGFEGVRLVERFHGLLAVGPDETGRMLSADGATFFASKRDDTPTSK